jgi:hypothetical protein
MSKKMYNVGVLMCVAIISASANADDVAPAQLENPEVSSKEITQEVIQEPVQESVQEDIQENIQESTQEAVQENIQEDIQKNVQENIPESIQENRETIPAESPKKSADLRDERDVISLEHEPAQNPASISKSLNNTVQMLFSNHVPVRTVPIIRTRSEPVKTHFFLNIINAYSAGTSRLAISAGDYGEFSLHDDGSMSITLYHNGEPSFDFDLTNPLYSTKEGSNINKTVFGNVTVFNEIGRGISLYRAEIFWNMRNVYQLMLIGRYNMSITMSFARK